MKIKLYNLNYKGKYDVLSDSPDDFVYSRKVEIDTEDFDWLNHVAAADYYGIYPYYGTNQVIKDKILEAESKLKTLQE